MVEIGRVIKFYNSFFFVKVGEEIIPCKLRGLLKRDKKIGSAVYVGDFVEISRLKDKSGVIEKVQSRRNVLIRPSIANVDRVILTFAVDAPKLHPLLLNRFLVLAEKSLLDDIIICVNKIDLTSEKNFLSEYESLYKVLRVSTITGEGLAELKKILSSGVSVFAGASGVGKSSLLNALDKNLQLKVGKVSEKILRGKHTTRVAELINFGEGFLVDTPGFSAVDLTEAGINKGNLKDYFVEFKNFAGGCKFLNVCSHSHEPDCGVKAAVERGEILRERYESYLTLLEEVTTGKIF
ncbi:MAG: ribosome small subunit-dependent GTPase A [Selenomonadaceae bacterium]|nr:ribosome small subunit-dependent GTPase A [Selenomonadaceae bacterium]